MNPKWVKVIRTSIQCLIGLMSVLPWAIPALGLSATVGVGAAVLAVSASLTRVMQIPQVEQLLSSLNLHTQVPPSE